MGQAKNKKQRECPAKGGIITPEDCGRGRNSSISCPVDCIHNPFNPANYESLFDALEAKVIGYLTRKLADGLTPAQLRELGALGARGNEFEFHAFQAWRIHGTGLLEKWIDAGFHRQWKNDEQVLLRHVQTMRPSLLEIREVKDGTTCTAVDLLEPGEPFVLIDRSMAAVACRYQLGLCWTYEVPGGRRLSGAMSTPPHVDGLEPLEMLAALAAHLGAPDGLPREWLLEHMGLLAEAFNAIATARRLAAVKVSDLRRFTLRFPVMQGRAPDIAAVLSANPRVFVEEEGLPFSASLLAEGADRERDDEAEVIGELRVEADELVVESFGAKRADGVRALLASMGLPVGQEHCDVVDAGAELAGKTYDRDLVPAAFLADPSPLDFPTTVRLREGGDDEGFALTAIYRGFADKPNEAFGGKTPRELAADPTLRPRLVRLLKNFTTSCDRQRRTNGFDFDFNDVLRELGLDELILPPPPVGIAERDEDDDEDLPLDPPPPQELLEGEELGSRLDRVIGDEALWNRLEIRLADILDAFNDLPDKLNPHELSTLQSTVLTALGALHPDQPPGYEPDPERMLARYESWMKSGDDQESVGDFLDRIFAETRQPELCESAADLLIHLEKESGKKLRPKKLDALFTAIAAAIWEAAHWPPVLKPGA